ncbi:MAG: hypothetical protein Aurels2KO_21730 [Aureliella sp.]
MSYTAVNDLETVKHAVPINPRTLLSFGHRPEKQESWSELLASLSTDKNVQLSVSLQFAGTPEELTRVKVWDKDTPDFTVLEFEFLSKKGFLPKSYVHSEEGELVLAQQWEWLSDKSHWRPSRYELQFENRNAPGRWETWDIATSTISSIPRDEDLSLAAIEFSTFDRHVDLRTHTLRCFNGEKWVPIEECEKGAKPVRNGLALVWIVSIGAGICLLLWKRQKDRKFSQESS